MNHYDNPNVSELPPGFTGYVIENEDLDFLADVSISADAWFANLPDTWAYPQSVNALNWVVTENQGQIGSCAGHGFTTVGEGIWFLETGIAPVFSPWAAYRLAQEKDGIHGDSGSTIAGNVWVGKNIGLVPKEICPPYPASYGQGWQITDKMREAANPWRIKSAVDCRGYEATLKFLKAGHGFVYTGSIWPAGMDGQGDKIHSFYGPRRNDRHGGGHSVCILGWSSLLCPDGFPYLIIHNSWSKRWGNDGAKYMSRRAYNEMSEHKQTVLVGVSDILEPRGPRQFEFHGNIVT